MLGKLIKYEFKSTSRVMWFLYGGLIIIGLLLGLFIRIQASANGNPNDIDDFPLLYSIFGQSENVFLRITVGAFTAIYVLLIWATAIMTTIMIVTRFYRNILGGEGYLMHTLPVKTHNLILSKGIVAIIWMIIASVSAALSGVVWGVASGTLQYIVMNITWNEFVEAITYVLSSSIFWQFVILAIVTVITSILTFYISMAIGNLANKNKFVFSVLAYVGINIVMTILSSIILIGTGTFWEYFMSEKMLNQFMIIQIIEQIILGVGFFFGTNYILKNKLNLE